MGIMDSGNMQSAKKIIFLTHSADKASNLVQAMDILERAHCTVIWGGGGGGGTVS